MHRLHIIIIVDHELQALCVELQALCVELQVELQALCVELQALCVELQALCDDDFSRSTFTDIVVRAEDTGYSPEDENPTCSNVPWEVMEY